MQGPCEGFCEFLILDAKGFLLRVGMLYLLEISKGFALLLLQPVSGLVRLSQNGSHDFCSDGLLLEASVKGLLDHR